MGLHPPPRSPSQSGVLVADNWNCIWLIHTGIEWIRRILATSQNQLESWRTIFGRKLRKRESSGPSIAMTCSGGPDCHPTLIMTPPGSQVLCSYSKYWLSLALPFTSARVKIPGRYTQLAMAEPHAHNSKTMGQGKWFIIRNESNLLFWPQNMIVYIKIPKEYVKNNENSWEIATKWLGTRQLCKKSVSSSHKNR